MMCIYLGKPKSSGPSTSTGNLAAVAETATPTLSAALPPRDSITTTTAVSEDDQEIRDLEDRVRVLEAMVKASSRINCNAPKSAQSPYFHYSPAALPPPTGPAGLIDAGAYNCEGRECETMGFGKSKSGAGASCPILREGSSGGSCSIRANSISRPGGYPQTALHDRFRISEGGREEERRFIDRFFAGSWGMPLVVVHQTTFLSTLEEQLPMLRLAVCAMGGLMDPDQASVKAATWYFDKARNLAASTCFEDPSLDALQALILLASCSAAKGKMSAAWMLLGMAARMAHYLKVNFDPDELEPEECEGMTWLKFSTVKNPRSNAIWNLTDADLAAQLYNNPALQTSENAVIYLARLVDLFAQSADVLRRQPVEASAPILPSVNDSLVRLQAELDDFFVTLPEPIRLMCASENPFINPMDGDAMNVLFVIYMYHACHCMIHRPRIMKIVQMAPDELAKLPAEERRRLERSLEIGKTAAEVIAQKNELYLRSGADVGRQPPFAGFPIFECSLVLVLLSSRSSPFGSQPDPAYNFTLRRWLAMNLRTLKLLSRTWKVAGYVGSSLEALMRSVPGVQLPSHLLLNGAYLNATYADGIMETGRITAILSPPPEAVGNAVAPSAVTSEHTSSPVVLQSQQQHPQLGQQVATPATSAQSGSPDPVAVALAMLAQQSQGTLDRFVVERWLMHAHQISKIVGGTTILSPDAAKSAAAAALASARLGVEEVVAADATSPAVDAEEALRRMTVNGPATPGVHESALRTEWPIPLEGERGGDMAAATSEEDALDLFAGDGLEGENTEDFLERLIAGGTSKETMADIAEAFGLNTLFNVDGTLNKQAFEGVGVDVDSFSGLA
ncbi:hypothetical protein HK101_010640 [Irineochytrium annulatum]|nr:hypothetical protein HK101_010640 [Irineochytrium annulatum]